MGEMLEYYAREREKEKAVHEKHALEIFKNQKDNLTDNPIKDALIFLLEKTNNNPFALMHVRRLQNNPDFK